MASDDVEKAKADTFALDASMESLKKEIRIMCVEAEEVQKQLQASAKVEDHLKKLLK